MNEEEPPNLDGDERDALAATGRAIASVIPMFGGVVGELISQSIPAQRTERIVRYIRQLEERISALETPTAKLLSSPENIDLVEEGGFQAARALSDHRIDEIATLVASGLSADDATGVRKNRLAKLLAELDDDALLVLKAYGSSYGGDRSAWEKVSRPRPPALQSPVQEIDEAKLYAAGEEQLLRLGLLQKNYGHLKKGEVPPFDPRKGDFKHRLEIAYLGRMLLRAIGQPAPIDDRK